MTDLQKFFTAAGVLALVFIIGKTVKEKQSSFIDENLADPLNASGPAKKAFKPNTWTKVNGNWIWVNGQGELVIDNG